MRPKLSPTDERRVAAEAGTTQKSVRCYLNRSHPQRNVTEVAIARALKKLGLARQRPAPRAASSPRPSLPLLPFDRKPYERPALRELDGPPPELDNRSRAAGEREDS